MQNLQGVEELRLLARMSWASIRVYGILQRGERDMHALHEITTVWE